MTAVIIRYHWYQNIFLISCFIFQLTQSVWRASYSVESFIKYVLWQYMDDDRFAQNPSNKVNVQMQFKPALNAVSLRVLKPSATTKFENVQLPLSIVHEPWLLTMRKSLQKKIVDILYGVDKTVCLVDKMVVKTYDNVTLERHPSECWTLLTADSSRTRNLAIFEKLANQQLALRIIVDDRVIEFDGSNLGRVKIDGQNQNVDSRTPVTVRDNVSHKIILQIQMLAPDTVKVVAPEHYVKLIVSKDGVQIHASLLAYRNRMRGVCGDFNGEERSDLVGPDGCIHKIGQEFYDAYRVPLESSSQCQPRRPLLCIRQPSQAYQQQQQQQQLSYQQDRYQQPRRY